MTWRKVLIVFLIILVLLVLTSWLNPSPNWIRDLRNSLPKHPIKRFNRRDLSQIEQVIIHHTTGPTTQSPESVAQYHIGPNHISNDGMAGIAYHYMIDRQARVYQTNDLKAITWHVSGQNTRSIGLCFIGDYDELEPTQGQMRQLLKLLRYLNRKLGRRLQIAGHREYANKTCPGNNVDLDFIRQKINVA